ncbi:MAG: N-formylglutamate amidohydrolase, partial [Bdellovibrionales bacterium]|nr:N-formylglutamate amidohydrolase [Bdellovibrionales bacterium]
MIKPAVSDINYQIYRDISSPLRGILSIPHSGEEIPDRFYHHLTDDMAALMTDVDYQVEQLVDIPKLVSEQIAVVVAKVHRAAVDLNRPAEQAILNWKNNSQGVELVTAE